MFVKLMVYRSNFQVHSVLITCFTEERTENNSFPESERQEDFDFIDNGSLVELANSDSENFSK